MLGSLCVVEPIPLLCFSGSLVELRDARGDCELLNLRSVIGFLLGRYVATGPVIGPGENHGS